MYLLCPDSVTGRFTEVAFSYWRVRECLSWYLVSYATLAPGIRLGFLDYAYSSMQPKGLRLTRGYKHQSMVLATKGARPRFTAAIWFTWGAHEKISILTSSTFRYYHMFTTPLISQRVCTRGGRPCPIPAVLQAPVREKVWHPTGTWIILTG